MCASQPPFSTFPNSDPLEFSSDQFTPPSLDRSVVNAMDAPLKLLYLRKPRLPPRAFGQSSVRYQTLP